MSGKTGTSVDTALCLGDNYSIPGGLTYQVLKDILQQNDGLKQLIEMKWSVTKGGDTAALVQFESTHCDLEFKIQFVRMIWQE